MAEKAQLEQEIRETQAENEEIRHDIENSDDDGVISEYARDKLGLAYEDETVYYGD